MKLQAQRTEGSNAITRHSSQGVVINGQTYTQSLILDTRTGARPWGATTFEALTEEAFSNLGDNPPELVIFGSGSKLRFAHPSLLRGLMAQGIGVECMDTPAACRTYNVLLDEGRAVVAALLFDVE